MIAGGTPCHPKATLSYIPTWIVRRARDDGVDFIIYLRRRRPRSYPKRNHLFTTDTYIVPDLINSRRGDSDGGFGWMCNRRVVVSLLNCMRRLYVCRSNGLLLSGFEYELNRWWFPGLAVACGVLREYGGGGLMIDSWEDEFLVWFEWWKMRSGGCLRKLIDWLKKKKQYWLIEMIQVLMI